MPLKKFSSLFIIDNILIHNYCMFCVEGYFTLHNCWSFSVPSEWFDLPQTDTESSCLEEKICFFKFQAVDDSFTLNISCL